jgi:hypothetical protein
MNFFTCTTSDKGQLLKFEYPSKDEGTHKVARGDSSCPIRRARRHVSGRL